MLPTWLIERGETASFIVVTVALAISARLIARITGASPRFVEDAYWMGGLLFLVVGRLAFVAKTSPGLVTDVAVLIRFTDGIDPIGGALAALGWSLWRSRGAVSGPLWAASVAGLVLAAAIYDLACPVRASCYGIAATPPLGFSMHGLTEPRLPTPVIEGAVLLALLGIMVRLLDRWTAQRVAWALLASLIVTRLAILPLTVEGVPLAGALILGAVALVAAALALRSTSECAAPLPDAGGG
jgi:hypothetical protein